MHVIVIFEGLKKFTGVGPLFVGQLGKVFREVPQLACDNCPSICRQPLRNRVQVAALSDETRTAGSLWNIVALSMRKRFDILRAGFDRGRFDVRVRVRMMRFDQADVVKEELVAAGSADLAAFLKEHANFRSGAVVVVGQDLDDYRHLVRRVTFEDDMFHHQFVVADTRAFFHRAFNYIARDAGFARFVDHGREPRIRAGLSPAELRGHHDFFHEFSYELAFFQPGDFSFGVKPLATHTADVVSGARQPSKSQDVVVAASCCRQVLTGRLQQSVSKEKKRGCAHRPDREERDVVLNEIGIRHQSDTKEHWFPDVHPFSVNEGNKADRSEKQSANEIRTA